MEKSIPAPMAAHAFVSLAEDAGEDRVDMFGVVAQIEFLFDLGGGEGHDIISRQKVDALCAGGGSQGFVQRGERMPEPAGELKISCIIDSEPMPSSQAPYVLESRSCGVVVQTDRQRQQRSHVSVKRVCAQTAATPSCHKNIGDLQSPESRGVRALGHHLIEQAVGFGMNLVAKDPGQRD